MRSVHHAAPDGIRRSIKWSTNWSTRCLINRGVICRLLFLLVPAEGFEPPTP
jgi:hypothetical protein